MMSINPLTFETDEILRAGPLVNITVADEGFIVAAADGIVLYYKVSGEVEQLKIKAKARPSAIY